MIGGGTGSESLSPAVQRARLEEATGVVVARRDGTDSPEYVGGWWDKYGRRRDLTVAELTVTAVSPATNTAGAE
jgi:hypothetical protein